MIEVVIGPCTLLCGDSRALMPSRELVDCIVTDPPYGDTALSWDRRVEGWLPLARSTLQPHGSLWCFGSMRFFLASARAFDEWTFAQDVVWEKHAGSSFHADRFRRVHEHVLQFYSAGVAWAAVYKDPVTTWDATKRATTRAHRPAHMGRLGAHTYTSPADGRRLMRSVIYAPSCHGYAIHETQKPVEVLSPLVRYSCPPGGLVGDWFMGSASTAIAALQTGRRFIGCELDPAMFDRAVARVRREVEHPTAQQTRFAWVDEVS